ncbi:MAG: hypothetical protein ACOX75_02125 [Lachnospiraceae bacterium]
MILSIVSVVFSVEFAAGWIGLIFSVGAVVLAFVALNMIKPIKEITENPGRVFVKVTSIVGLIGLILGFLSIVLSIVCGIVYCTAKY